MPIKALIYAYRKAGLTPTDFKTHYESHITLLKTIAGSDFPLSHKRHYVARSNVETVPEGASTRNALTPATVLVGQQSDFDFDAYAEVMFADQVSFEAFGAKIYAPEAAARIRADEERFLDRERLGIVLLGEVVETKK